LTAHDGPIQISIIWASGVNLARPAG